MARPAIKTRTVTYEPTELGRRFQEARQAGAGVEPGAHPELAAGGSIGNPISQVRSGLKKMGTAFHNLMSPKDTAADEAQYKAEGDKAYYDAKYARSLGKK